MKTVKTLANAKRILGFIYPFVLALLSLLAWTYKSNDFSNSASRINEVESASNRIQADLNEDSRSTELR